LNKFIKIINKVLTKYIIITSLSINRDILSQFHQLRVSIILSN